MTPPPPQPHPGMATAHGSIARGREGGRGRSCDPGDSAGTSWDIAKVEAPWMQPRGRLCSSLPRGCETRREAACPIPPVAVSPEHPDPPPHPTTSRPPQTRSLGECVTGSLLWDRGGSSVGDFSAAGGSDRRKGGKRVVKGHHRAPSAPCPCPGGGISSPRPRHPQQHLCSEGCWVWGGCWGPGGTRFRRGSGFTSTQGAGVVECTGLPCCRSSLHAAPCLWGKRDQGFPKGSRGKPACGGTQCSRRHWGPGLPWAPEGLGWQGPVPRGGHPSEGLQAGACIRIPAGKNPKQGL